MKLYSLFAIVAQMSQPERTLGRFPSQPDQTTFIVDSLGNVETPESRDPQIIIHREQLSPQQRATTIDLDKVAGTSIYVVLQDFGLPFRTITINQVYISENDDGVREETNYHTPTKADKLSVACPSYGWNERTAIYTDGKNFNEDPVELEPGQRVVFAHDEDSSDFRNGFIRNDAHIAAFQDDWRNPEESRYFDRYTPIVVIAYEAKNLRIVTHDAANAEVIFEKLVSQADAATTTESRVSSEMDEATYREVIASLQNTLSPDQMKVVIGLVAGIQRLESENDSLTRRVEAGQMREQVIEVALTRNKRLLIETQERLQKAHYENAQLKKQAGGATYADPFSRFKSESGGSGADPYGYCGILGITPERLYEMPPQEAEKVVTALRRVYSNLYHPDRNSQVDPQMMRDINNAADRILTRLKTGSWGRI